MTLSWLMAALALLQPQATSDWRLVYNANFRVAAIELSSIDADAEGGPTARLVSVWRDPPSINGQVSDYSMNKVQIECEGLQFRLLEARGHNLGGETVWSDNSGTAWHDINPASSYAKAAAALCSNEWPKETLFQSPDQLVQVARQLWPAAE